MNHRQLAESISKKAGKIIKRNFSLGMKKAWKNDNTPITVTDKKINALLLQETKKYFPSYSVLAEEQSRLKKSEYVWVCDPLDGTIPFSHGIPICTFSLALVKTGQPILGVVSDPLGGRLFLAEKDKGTLLNGKRIKVSQTHKFKSAFSNCEMFETALYDITQTIDHLRFNEGVKLTSLASIVYSSMLVAAGEMAFAIFPHNTAHDVAAVKVIVVEAGGKVTDLFGKEQRYDKKINGAIISNGILHERLVDLTKKTAIKNNRIKK